MDDIKLVFAQGFTFLGKVERDLNSNRIIRIKDPMLMMFAPQPITLGLGIKSIQLYGDYIEADCPEQIVQDYIKATTGIDIASPKMPNIPTGGTQDLAQMLKKMKTK